MGRRKELKRDDYRAFLTVLKNELGIEYNTRSISSVENCRKAIKEIADEYAYQRNQPALLRVIQRNADLTHRYIELKDEIHQLKSKKWYQFWK